MADIPSYGDGARRGRLPPDEGDGATAIPPPPTMRNHGNYVVSVSQLGRFLGEQAEEAGAALLPETDAAEAARRATAASRASAPATRAAAATASSSANFEPGSDIVARVTVLAEGTQGHLTGAAIARFGLEGEQPAGLGARREGGLEGREAAATRSSTRWAGRCASAPSTASSAARSSIRWARTWSRSASSPASSTATSSSPCTTCSRSSRRTGSSAGSSRGGERVAWGAKTITEGGYPRAADALQRAGPAPRRRGRRASSTSRR